MNMSMSTGGDATMVQPGMEVYGCDAERLGVVKETRAGGFLVGQARHGDVFVPRGVVSEVSEAERRVDLSVRASELPDQEPHAH